MKHVLSLLFNEIKMEGKKENNEGKGREEETEQAEQVKKTLGNEEKEEEGGSKEETEGEVSDAIYPLKVADKIIKDRHVNLLLTEKDGNQHYSTIRNFSRLLSSQMS